MYDLPSLRESEFGSDRAWTCKMHLIWRGRDPNRDNGPWTRPMDLVGRCFEMSLIGRVQLAVRGDLVASVVLRMVIRQQPHAGGIWARTVYARCTAGEEMLAQSYFCQIKESITAQYAFVDADSVEGIANSPSSQTRTVAKMRLLVFAHENLLSAWDTPGRGCEAARVSTSHSATRHEVSLSLRLVVIGLLELAAVRASSSSQCDVTMGFPLTAQADSESGPSSAVHHDGRRSTFHLPKSPIMLGAGASTSTAIGSKRDGPCRLSYTRLQ